MDLHDMTVSMMGNRLENIIAGVAVMSGSSEKGR